MGQKYYKREIIRNIASFREQKNLYYGRVVDRPYRSDVTAEKYTAGTAATAQDLTATSDTLTVNESWDIFMYVDNIHKIQNKYNAADAWAGETRVRLSNVIDAYGLHQVFNAADTIDDGDIGGTTGNGITVTKDNVFDIFAATAKKLDVNNVPLDQRVLAISPQFKEKLILALGGRETALGDRTGENGNIGRWHDFELYLSNNLTGSARWTPANNPSNSDTVTINSITFTFVTSIGSTAGNILIGTATADTIDNAVGGIDAPGTTTSTFVALSAANTRTVSLWDGVDGTTYLEVRVRGGSFLTVTGSDAADVWTATRQIQNITACRRGAMDMVVQQTPDVDIAPATTRGLWGINILAMILFGTATFNLGTTEMFRVEARSDAY